MEQPINIEKGISLESLSDSKKQEEKGNEEMSLQCPESGGPSFGSQRIFTTITPAARCPKIVPPPHWGATTPPIWRRNRLPLEDWARHPVWPGSIPIQSLTIPFEEVLDRQYKPEDEPAGYYWALNPFFTSDLLNWKNYNPSSREGPRWEVEDLITSIFVTHHSDWTYRLSLASY